MFQVTTLLSDAAKNKKLPKPTDDELAAARTAKAEAEAELANVKAVCGSASPSSSSAVSSCACPLPRRSCSRLSCDLLPRAHPPPALITLVGCAKLSLCGCVFLLPLTGTLEDLSSPCSLSCRKPRMSSCPRFP